MEPIIKLNNINHIYSSEAGKVYALSDINLEIMPGEMVSIIGTSGSGKSTLMNILGCINRATSGIYTIAGNSTKELNDDEISKLRREYFGFIFQSYHLLPNLTAIENVELPAFYSGIGEKKRQAIAKKLLQQFGLENREFHYPSQLSGGQQQRVSISRALVNGGNIILADEPTGALDSKSGHEVLQMLRSLQQEGHTIIIITHDPKIAESTDRVIQLHDGKIINDTNNVETTSSIPYIKANLKIKDELSFASHISNAVKTALNSIKKNALRSILTVLGIVIGIASVVSIVALGQGTRDSVLNNFNDIANLSLTIYPGTEGENQNESSQKALVLSDVDTLQKIPAIEYVRPQIESMESLRYDRYDAQAQILGVGISGFKKDGGKIILGRDFRVEDIERNAQVILLSTLARKKLFHDNNPIGKFVLAGKLPCRIIGVVSDSNNISASGENITVRIPYTTMSIRMLGKRFLNSISVRTLKHIGPEEGESIITKVLEKKHGKKDFYIYNNQQAFASLDSTTFALTLGLGFVAGISLLVGGIGVMNIMLVSVSERIREIGIRRAVGARQKDILNQFLVESIFLCMVGGCIGIISGIVICRLVTLFQSTIQASISLLSVTIAFFTCILIGIFFGVFPAKKAAQLDPALALARE